MASQRERIRIVEHLYGNVDSEQRACKMCGTKTGRIHTKVPPVVKLGQGDYETSLNPDPSFPSWFTFSNLLRVCFIVGAALFIVWAIRLP